MKLLVNFFNFYHSKKVKVKLLIFFQRIVILQLDVQEEIMQVIQ